MPKGVIVAQAPTPACVAWPTIALSDLPAHRHEDTRHRTERIKAIRHDKGLIELSVDALVQPRPAKDERITSTLSLAVDDARTLIMLLKQQVAELDKLNPRSRRSGRC